MKSDDLRDKVIVTNNGNKVAVKLGLASDVNKS